MVSLVSVNIQFYNFILCALPLKTLILLGFFVFSYGRAPNIVQLFYISSNISLFDLRTYIIKNIKGQRLCIKKLNSRFRILVLRIFLL